MKHVFVVNPVSGKEDASVGMVPHIIEAAAQIGANYEVQITQGPKDATRIATHFAGQGGPVRLYAVGGDGTLNEVMAGAYLHKNAEVASVPVGSGNDFVRNFGAVEDFLNLPAQLQGAAVSIDLMQTDTGISMAITSTGLDAEVAYNIPKYRRIPLVGGTMAYNISIAEKILRPLGKQLRVAIDGKVQQGKYIIATVCNGQTYGGGYRAAPMAKLNDGVLDIILVKKMSRLRIAQIIGKYKKGQHFKNGAVIPAFRDIMEYHRGGNITITPTGKEPFILNVDGECGPAPRLYAKVLPLAGRFVLPLHLANKL